MRKLHWKTDAPGCFFSKVTEIQRTASLKKNSATVNFRNFFRLAVL